MFLRITRYAPTHPPLYSYASRTLLPPIPYDLLVVIYLPFDLIDLILGVPGEWQRMQAMLNTNGMATAPGEIKCEKHDPRTVCTRQWCNTICTRNAAASLCFCAWGVHHARPMLTRYL